MATLNKVFLLGNLTRVPELRYIQSSGAAVCEFGMAMNRRYRTATGEDKEETCFVDIVVWGKQGENCSRYLKKGSPALIEGRLHMDQWQDRESGKNRSKLRIVAERVQFVGSPQGQDRDEGGMDNIPFNQQVSRPQAPPQPAYNQPAMPQPDNRSFQQPQPDNRSFQPQPQQAPQPPPQQAFNPEDEENGVEDDIPF